MANISPWEDLTEDITLPNPGGEPRVFRLREMTRVESDRLSDLYFSGVEKMRTEAEALGREVVSAADFVKRAFSLQWDTLAPALQLILREPIDGSEKPSLEWIRANLNERRATMLIETQERLNGTDKLKKKAETLAQEMALRQSKVGFSSTTGSPTDTEAGPTTSGDDSLTDRPS